MKWIIFFIIIPCFLNSQEYSDHLISQYQEGSTVFYAGQVDSIPYLRMVKFSNYINTEQNMKVINAGGAKLRFDGDEKYVGNWELFYHLYETRGHNFVFDEKEMTVLPIDYHVSWRKEFSWYRFLGFYLLVNMFSFLLFLVSFLGPRRA
jgi:hypothetical protein